MKRILYVGNKLSSFGFTPTGIDYLGNLLEQNGYSVTYAGDKRNKVVRLISIVKRIIQQRKNYDFILIDTYSSSAFYFCVISAVLARLLRKPYIPILHGGNLPDRLKQSPALIRQVLVHAYRVVSVSQYLQKIFSSICPVDFIPNFIELKKYPFKERKKMLPRLLWVRSFHKIYNPELTVHIVAKLKSEFPSIFLTMVGPDKDGSRTHVQNLAKQLGVDDRIRITGKLSKQDWIALAADHDIFVNTTNFDNMPVSVIEAMALGLPVVSTNVGGIPFLISDGVTGLLVAKDNVNGFCNAIDRLMKDAVFACSIIKDARQLVQGFNEEAIAVQWKAILS